MIFRTVKIGLRAVFLFLMMLSFGKMKLLAQCISTFPYTEGFETDDGHFATGGTNSSWAWGTPQKSIITKAASGSKCWITGGLTGNSYPNYENSTLESPCFDFSDLTKPEISFSLFWEVENTWDGASLEYTVDDGQHWLTIGAYNEPACQSVNWFNNPRLNFFDGPAWSGTTKPTQGQCRGGGGSGGWVYAQHSIDFLAGYSQVRFRFHFAVGGTCNAYNGFAMDNFSVREAKSPTVDFSYACQQGNNIQFSNNSTLCGEWLWDFGDPNSNSNSSTLMNPRHTYTQPGDYTVTLTSRYTSNNTVIQQSKPVHILGATAEVLQNVSCFGKNDGIASVNVINGAEDTHYTWSSSPEQSAAVATQLYAGTYMVSVTRDNACPTEAYVTITEPNTLTIRLDMTNTICNNANGAILSDVTGGTLPYNYLWNNGATENKLTNISSGSYLLSVTDKNGCTASANTVIENINKDLQISLGNDTSFCPGNTLLLNPGIFEHYLWQDHSNNSSYLVSKSGRYSVTVTDQDGCKASSSIYINVDCSEVFFPSGFTPNNDGNNDRFGAVGNIRSIKNYVLKVYNRWGQLVFQTNTPDQKWDGTVNGKMAENGTYVYVSSFYWNSFPQTRKGTITLIR